MAYKKIVDDYANDNSVFCVTAKSINEALESLKIDCINAVNLFSLYAMQHTNYSAKYNLS